MTKWKAEELERIEAADELEIASVRSDRTLGSRRTIWVVRVDDHLYVRLVNGRTSDWIRGTQQRHEGWIRAGGVERNVAFVEADADLGPGSMMRTARSTAGTPRASSTPPSRPRRARRH